MNGDGIPDLVNDGVYIAFGKGSGKFGTPVHYAVQSFQLGANAALGVLSGNGLTDIVVQGSPFSVSVLLNIGGGRFQDGEFTPVAGGAGCGAAADYNGDGKTDLAVNTSSGITILLGTGNAKSPFTTGSTVSLANAGCLITGDLNGDGIADLLVPGNGVVNAYLGKGDGTFTLKSSTVVSSAVYLVLGDFNHDGKLDFASSGNLLALENGDGTFELPAAFVPNPPSNGFTNVAVGDINNDGWPDLLLTDYAGFIYVLLNNQHGQFTQSQIPTAAGSDPNQIVLGDLNGDGKLDFVFTGLAGGGTVYLGNGEGGFTKGVTLPDYLLGIPAIAAISDVNGDGLPDILLDEGSSVAIFLGKGNGTFGTPFYIGAGPSPGSIYTENLHGQLPTAGLADVVVPDNSGGVTVLINTTK